jgi:hypothetical protein
MMQLTQRNSVMTLDVDLLGRILTPAEPIRLNIDMKKPIKPYKDYVLT